MGDLAGAYAINATGVATVWIDAAATRVLRGTPLAKTIEALLLYNTKVTSVNIIVQQNSTTTCSVFQSALEKFVQQAASSSCGPGRSSITPYTLASWTETGLGGCQDAAVKRRADDNRRNSPPKDLITVAVTQTVMVYLVMEILDPSTFLGTRIVSNHWSPSARAQLQDIRKPKSIYSQPWPFLAVTDGSRDFVRTASECSAGKTLVFPLSMDSTHPAALEIRRLLMDAANNDPEPQNSRPLSVPGSIYAVTSPVLMHLHDWHVYTQRARSTPDASTNSWDVEYSLNDGIYYVSVILNDFGIYGETTILFSLAGKFANVLLDITISCGVTTTSGVDLAPVEALLKSSQDSELQGGPGGRGAFMAWNVQGMSTVPLAGKKMLVQWYAQQNAISLFHEGGSEVFAVLKDSLPSSGNCAAAKTAVTAGEGFHVDDCWVIPASLSNTNLDLIVTDRDIRPPYAFRVHQVLTPKQLFAVIPLHWKSDRKKKNNREVQIKDLNALIFYAEYMRVTFGLAVVAGGDFNNPAPAKLLPQTVLDAKLLKRAFGPFSLPAQNLPTYMGIKGNSAYDFLWFMHGPRDSTPPQSFRAEKKDIDVFSSADFAALQNDKYCKFLPQISCGVEFSNHFPVIFTLRIGRMDVKLLSWNLNYSPFLLEIAPSSPGANTPDDNDYNTRRPPTVDEKRKTRFIQYMKHFDIMAFQEGPAGVKWQDTNGNAIGHNPQSDVEPVGDCDTLKYNTTPEKLLRACMFKANDQKFIVISLHDYSDDPPLIQKPSEPLAPTLADVAVFRQSLSTFCMTRPPKSDPTSEGACEFSVAAEDPMRRIPIIVIGDFNPNWNSEYTKKGQRMQKGIYPRNSADGSWTYEDTIQDYKNSYEPDRNQYSKNIASNLGLSCSSSPTSPGGIIFLPGIDDTEVNPNQACGISGSHRLPWATTPKGSYLDFMFYCDPGDQIQRGRAKIDSFLQGFESDSQCPKEPNPNPNPGADSCTEGFGTGTTYKGWPCLLDDSSDHRPVYARRKL
ncbi:hypothetical protein HDU88_002537 [Geranomyces variabilis]|nr:hypothetical protein HDU88_002537 [Geranomyces variabilis]